MSIAIFEFSLLSVNYNVISLFLMSIMAAAPSIKRCGIGLYSLICEKILSNT